jgi:heterodisulfide reductase subunit A
VKLRYEDQEAGGCVTREHDLAVLSLAMVPAWDPRGVLRVDLAADGFVRSVQPKLASPVTDQEGVFVAGVAAGPKDIVDSIAEAGSAAMQVANYLTERRTARATA